MFVSEGARRGLCARRSTHRPTARFDDAANVTPPGPRTDRTRTGAAKVPRGQGSAATAVSTPGGGPRPHVRRTNEGPGRPGAGRLRAAALGSVACGSNKLNPEPRGGWRVGGGADPPLGGRVESPNERFKTIQKIIGFKVRRGEGAYIGGKFRDPCRNPKLGVCSTEGKGRFARKVTWTLKIEGRRTSTDLPKKPGAGAGHGGERASHKLPTDPDPRRGGKAGFGWHFLAQTLK